MSRMEVPASSGDEMLCFKSEDIVAVRVCSLFLCGSFMKMPPYVSVSPGLE